MMSRHSRSVICSRVIVDRHRVERQFTALRSYIGTAVDRRTADPNSHHETESAQRTRPLSNGQPTNALNGCSNTTVYVFRGLFVARCLPRKGPSVHAATTRFGRRRSHQGGTLRELHGPRRRGTPTFRVGDSRSPAQRLSTSRLARLRAVLAFRRSVGLRDNDRIDFLYLFFLLYFVFRIVAIIRGEWREGRCSTSRRLPLQNTAGHHLAALLVLRGLDGRPCIALLP